MDSRRIQGWLFFVFSVALIPAALYSARNLFAMEPQPWGDGAADLLLTRKITEDGYLLTGHYSRFGFNHPGPFFFYANHFAEELFIPFGVTQFGAWVLSTCLLNLACFLSAAYMLAQLYVQRPLLPALAAVALSLCVMGDGIFNQWAPFRLPAPYFAFLCSLLVLAQGQWRFLPAAVLFACISIHGYVTLPLFTLPPLALACLQAWKRQHSPTALKKPLPIAGAIAIVFVLPILVDAIRFPHDNLRRLLGAAAVNAGRERDYPGVLALLVQFWLNSLFLLVPAFLLWFALVRCRRVTQVPLLCTFLLTLLVSLLFVLYYAGAPPLLHEFVAYFYHAVVLAVLAMLLLTAMLSLGRNTRTVFVATMLSLSVAVTALNHVPQPIDAAQVGVLSAELAAGSPRSLRLDYAVDTMWPDAAGIIYRLRNSGIDACVVRPNMAFLFTDNAICDVVVADYMLVPDSRCDNQCLAMSNGVGVVKLPQQIINAVTITTNKRVHE